MGVEKGKVENACQDWEAALTVGKVGALSNLDDITVRIADVAADLAVLGDRLSNEFGSPAFP